MGPDADAGTAIEHTAVLQLRGRTFGPPLIKRIYLPMPIAGARKVGDMQRSEGQKQRVRDLKPGDKVDSYFSVSYRKPVSEYKYGSMFEFRAVDRSGQITVKYWGGDDKQAVQCIHDSFDRGDVVKLRGEVSDYRGALEISVSQKNGGMIERLAEGQYSLTELVDTVDNIDELKARLIGFMDQVEEPHLRRLLDSFFADEEYLKAFCLCPASIQLHSAAFGGLLKHTISVAAVCGQVLKLHPELDRDLVIAGALLHDIGKVQSFRVTTHIDQTTEGNLVGHIILGDQELMGHISGIDGFPEDLAGKLRHILLAHHGRKEWGSPVDPMMPEALAVHEADDLDAKLDYMIAKRRDAVTEDDWIWDSRLGRLIYLR
jgi:3'-5' exoribonuclease